MDSQDDEILQSFIDESREHLADISNSSTYVGRSAQDLSTLTKQLKGMVEKFKV